MATSAKMKARVALRTAAEHTLGMNRRYVFGSFVAASLAACTVPLPPMRATEVPARPPPAVETTAPPTVAEAAPRVEPEPARARAPTPDVVKPAEPAPKTAPKPAAKAPPPAKPAAVAKPAPAIAAPPPLDLKSLEQRLKQTGAIGVLTKLSLKNQVDDLVERFRAFHEGRRPPTLAELRPAFDLLLMKVLSLLQDQDAPLANDVNASRDAIWSVLSDREKLARYAS